MQSRLEAARDIVYAERDRDRAMLEAEALVERAKGEAEAAIERARGEAAAFILMQEAWGALPPELRANMLLSQLAIEKWNGVLPRVVGGDGFDLILSDIIIDGNH
jgi:hypothetical protein